MTGSCLATCCGKVQRSAASRSGHWSINSTNSEIKFFKCTTFRTSSSGTKFKQTASRSRLIRSLGLRFFVQGFLSGVFCPQHFRTHWQAHTLILLAETLCIRSKDPLRLKGQTFQARSTHNSFHTGMSAQGLCRLQGFFSTPSQQGLLTSSLSAWKLRELRHAGSIPVHSHVACSHEYTVAQY